MLRHEGNRFGSQYPIAKIEVFLQLCHCKNMHTSMRWTYKTINYSNPYRANKKPRLKQSKGPNPNSRIIENKDRYESGQNS